MRRDALRQRQPFLFIFVYAHAVEKAGDVSLTAAAVIRFAYAHAVAKFSGETAWVRESRDVNFSAKFSGEAVFVWGSRGVVSRGLDFCRQFSLLHYIDFSAKFGGEAEFVFACAAAKPGGRARNSCRCTKH